MKTISRRDFMKTTFSAVAGAAFLSKNSTAFAQPKRPNVIFIITDDQPVESFGFLKQKALTPNIDRLSEKGAYFSKFYVCSSVCSPSRYTCLSGQYASRCNIPFFKNQCTEDDVTRVLWNVGYEHNQVTLPKALKREGYKTGLVGKWHINGVLDKCTPIAKGSDPFSPQVKKTMQENYTIICNGIKNFGFDYVSSAYAGNLHDDPNLRNTGCDEHNMEWMTKAALDFIDDNKDNPFYLYFAPTLLHVPNVTHSLVHADPRISGEGMLDEPITDIMPSRKSVIERVKAKGINMKYAGATWLDDGIGALIKRLEKHGIADNTLIIYFNDHGMNHGSKGTCYEGGLITPTMAYWPGKIKPQKCDELMQNIDFAPTILDVCGVAVPAEMKIDGKSFMPVLEGKTKKLHDAVYSEIGITRAISTKKWKYIAFHVPASLQRTQQERLADHKAYIESVYKSSGIKIDPDPEAKYYQMGMEAGGSRFERGQLTRTAPWKKNYFDPDQLYDLENDPLETTNLALDPKYKSTLEMMQKKLQDFLEDLPGTYPGLKP